MGRFGGGARLVLPQESPSKDSVSYYDNTLVQRAKFT